MRMIGAAADGHDRQIGCEPRHQLIAAQHARQDQPVDAGLQRLAVQALRTSGNTLTDSFTYTVRDTAGLTSSTTLP